MWLRSRQWLVVSELIHVSIPDGKMSWHKASVHMLLEHGAQYQSRTVLYCTLQ